MESIDALMHKAFSTCNVSGNLIQFAGSYSEKEIMDIYSRFSNDLLDYKIPHYRVVGIKMPEDITNSSVIRAHKLYGISPIILSGNASNIIPAKLGGHNNEGSYVDDDGPASVEDGTMTDLNILRKGGEIGQLMHMHTADHLIREIGDGFEEDITQENLRFRQYSLIEAEKEKPRFLLKKFCVGSTKGMELKETTFFYMKGTGTKDFSENAKLFKTNSRVLPCRTTWDLTKFMTVKYPTGDSNNTLTLYYRAEINTDVLADILNEYGRSFDYGG